MADGEIHGVDGSAENVATVDFIRSEGCHRPSKSVAFDGGAEFVSLFSRELFGVVETVVTVVFGKDHRCGKHWTRKAATTGFVATAFNQIGGVGRE